MRKRIALTRKSTRFAGRLCQPRMRSGFTETHYHTIGHRDYGAMRSVSVSV
jgi:hypothetical protein